MAEAVLWETVLQSPYSVKFTHEQVRRQILEDLFENKENGGSLLSRIGIVWQFDGSYEDMLEDAIYRKDYQQKNVMLQEQLRANYRTEYWEISFLHTKAFASVPDDMMCGK